MERRDGPEYAFNEPMLEGVLDRVAPGDPDVVIALLFLGPGKHAGPGGDISQIIQASAATKAKVNVYTTTVLGTDPLVVDILADRAAGALGTERAVCPVQHPHSPVRTMASGDGSGKTCPYYVA